MSKALVNLLIHARKYRILKSRKDSDRLYWLGTIEGKGMIERVRRGRTVLETAQEEAGKLDINIWEDDPWGVGFTYAIQALAELTCRVNIMKHNDYPPTEKEIGFMKSILDIPYIGTRGTNYENYEPI